MGTFQNTFQNWFQNGALVKYITVDSTNADYSDIDIISDAIDEATEFKYLQNAINEASINTVIRVKNGTYKPTHLSTSPTVYSSGDRLDKNATFSTKSGVNIVGAYGGGVTIFSGDIADEAVIDAAKLIGDRRTDLSKLNAAYNVITDNSDVVTKLQNVTLKYGSGSIGAGAKGNTLTKKFLLLNCKIEDCSIASVSASYGGGVYGCTLLDSDISYCQTDGANNGGGASHCDINGGSIRYCYSDYYGGGFFNCNANNCSVSYCEALYSGGGWHSSTVDSCIASYCESGNNGGGWYLSTCTNSDAIGCITFDKGGGWFDSICTDCNASYCTASAGGGWNKSNSTNCVAKGCIGASTGGGWVGSLSTYNINCIAINCYTPKTAGGWSGANCDNCVAINCQADLIGGAWYQGVSYNCVAINCVGPQAVRRISTDIELVNCYFLNNKNSSGSAVFTDSINTTKVQIIKNCAYDTINPTGTVGAGSDWDISSCISSITIAQIKISIPSFVGYTVDSNEKDELDTYLDGIVLNMSPTVDSNLLNAGINSTAYPAPSSDYAGNDRPIIPNAVTIGILE